VSKGVSSAAGDDPGIKSVILTLAANSAFRHLLLGYSVWYFFGNGLLQWVPAFFMRAHGLASGELGSWLALVNGAAMLLGVYWGGEWSSRRAANNERLQLIFVASMALFYIAFYAAALLVSNYYVAFALIAIGSIGGNMSQGPLLATMQTLVPSRMRATALAFVYFIANLIGMGFGPLAVGALSDALYPTLGTESLRYALLACCSGYIWMAWHIWRASRTVARDVATTERQHEESTHGQLASVRAG
jgi:MFS family permease